MNIKITEQKQKDAAEYEDENVACEQQAKPILALEYAQAIPKEQTSLPIYTLDPTYL